MVRQIYLDHECPAVELHLDVLPELRPASPRLTEVWAEAHLEDCRRCKRYDREEGPRLRRMDFNLNLLLRRVLHRQQKP